MDLESDLMNIPGLERFTKPYEHWVCENFIPRETVRWVNATWPAECPEWYVEKAGYARKSALMFPQRLHEAAQGIARQLYSTKACAELSELVGFQLLPDPWFLDGPTTPRLGGGLHEIGPGGLLKIHIDFDVHPTGLQRAANLLIYLNEDWDDAWGGSLELHGEGVKRIYPRAGTAAFFVTDENSWHGHPHPLACPPDRSRRSLALYYYRERTGHRPTTVYRR